MASFKTFVESSGDFFKGLVYASQADTWNDANDAPSNLWALQNRWEVEEEEEDRPFHNIDSDAFSQVKYKDVASSNMPGVGAGFWRHKKDDPRKSSLKVNDTHLYNLGDDKSKNTIKPPPSPVLNYELDRLFGELPPQEYDLPPDFDKPWRKKYED
jgi:hypothetical protein